MYVSKCMNIVHNYTKLQYVLMWVVTIATCEGYHIPSYSFLIANLPPFNDLIHVYVQIFTHYVCTYMYIYTHISTYLYVRCTL